MSNYNRQLRHVYFCNEKRHQYLSATATIPAMPVILKTAALSYDQYLFSH